MKNQLYNHGLLAYQMEQLDKTPQGIAKEARVSIFAVHAALAGNLGTLKVLRRLTDALHIDWKFITHTDLKTEKELSSAVLNGRAKR